MYAVIQLLNRLAMRLHRERWLQTLYSERASSHDLSNAESSHSSADESCFCLLSMIVMKDICNGEYVETL